jgi:hypothetical protein
MYVGVVETFKEVMYVETVEKLTRDIRLEKQQLEHLHIPPTNLAS